MKRLSNHVQTDSHVALQGRHAARTTDFSYALQISTTTALSIAHISAEAAKPLLTIIKQTPGKVTQIQRHAEYGGVYT